MNDVIINAVSKPSTINTTINKPSYLVILKDDSIQIKKMKYFISIDKPDFLNGFISVKGIYANFSEKEIILNFNDMLTNSKKDLLLEVMFPWHRIISIRNLTFRAK
jgi:hypothetical protein